MRNRTMTAMGAAVLAVVLCILGGCAGPSTRILPGGHGGTQKPPVILPDAVVLEEANPFYLKEALETVAGAPRGRRQSEEDQIVEYLRQMLTDYGYNVTLQSFQTQDPGEGAVQRTNVVAVGSVPSPDADIVLVGCCHGTAPGSPGAVHSGSGVVAMLETARILSSLPTDTELRFVSFSDGAGADGAVRRYLASLPQEEMAKIIGVIQLGAVGYYGDPGMVLKTDDGKATLLGDLIREAAGKTLQEDWHYRSQEQGIPSLFVRQGIPAVEAGQLWEAYEAGSPYDRTELVDMERVAQVVNTLSQVLADIMGSDTPSLLAKSRYYNNLHAGEYVQREDSSIRFGQSHEETDICLGMTGTLASENTDSQGRSIRSYQYRMKWFNVDQIILTSYYYQDDQLEEIFLDSDGAGIGLGEMKERISQIYGIPWAGSAGPNGMEYHWEDPVFRLHFILTPVSDGYDLVVREYHAPRMELYAGALGSGTGPETVQDPVSGDPGPDLTGGQEAVPGTEGRQEPASGSTETYQEISGTEKAGADTEGLSWGQGEAYDTRRQGVVRILEVLEGLYPQELSGYVESVHIYTDGVGASGSYVEPVADGENGSSGVFRLWIDWNDVLRPDGSFRDRTGFVREMLRLQGQILMEAEEGTFREAFETLFLLPESSLDGDVLVQPGVGPGEEAVELPDFAESYQWFILASIGQEDDAFSRRVRFFYGLDGMTSVREKIRGYLLP